ncbi:MAG: beta-ketoacyl-acyl-carrier-protein synthase [Phycisphaerales bacterium]|jgi:3-oxoacyl-[acyl-carrier-protein] synthase II|nr:beta-ketoacyl-acyl-carrier-protein synthase [Phycisphaerales bacterium]
MARRRVVITGLGVVTSLGESTDEMWDKLCAGESGITVIRRWNTEKYPVKIGGECFTFDLAKYAQEAAQYTDERLQPRRIDRFGQFGLAASMSAVKDAGLDFGKEDRTRCGVIIGTGIGGIETIEEQYKILIDRGVSRVSPFTVPRLMPNAASGNVSILFRLNGPNTAVSTACATGSNAIGDAARLVQHDLAEVMIAGGSEAALCELGMATFCAARALSTRNSEPTRASRPWDKGRDGFVMAEGAGVVILEEYEHAKKRGARIYAELVGYGMSGDGYHITAPDEQGRGASFAMNLALKDAGVSPEVVDYINAHGTSTPLGDLAETKAVKSSFGDHARKLSLSSTKSQLGHLLGASGGVEAIISSLAIHRNLIPPTINLEEPDPECDLDYTPLKAKDKKITYAMSNSFGFGGHNASLLFKKC